MPTIYLDACCLNRPFDDQSQDRIRLEAEAILIILNHVKNDEWQWISSTVLGVEIQQIPDAERQARIKLLMPLARHSIHVSQKEEKRAKELQTLGIHPFDATHLACAESGSVDVFLTTDDQLLRQAVRLSAQLGVRVENPLVWVKEQSEK